MCVYFKKNMHFPMLYFGFLEGTGALGAASVNAGPDALTGRCLLRRSATISLQPKQRRFA